MPTGGYLTHPDRRSAQGLVALAREAEQLGDIAKSLGLTTTRSPFSRRESDPRTSGRRVEMEGDCPPGTGLERSCCLRVLHSETELRRALGVG